MPSKKRFFKFYKSFPLIPLFRVTQCKEKDLNSKQKPTLLRQAQFYSLEASFLSCQTETIAYDLIRLLAIGRNR